MKSMPLFFHVLLHSGDLKRSSTRRYTAFLSARNSAITPNGVLYRDVQMVQYQRCKSVPADDVTSQGFFWTLANVHPERKLLGVEPFTCTTPLAIGGDGWWLLLLHQDVGDELEEARDMLYVQFGASLGRPAMHVGCSVSLALV